MHFAETLVVKDTHLLKKIKVLEVGNRIAVAICGGLLRDVGAEVSVIKTDERLIEKWQADERYLVGKQYAPDVVTFENFQTQALEADILVLSSDVDPAWVAAAAQQAKATAKGLIVLDITATGSFGPLAGVAFSDLQIQALCGLIDTTGASGQIPEPVGFPFAEVSAALYGSVAVLAALHARDRSGEGQAIEVSLYDTAVNALMTFLPKAFAGHAVSRIGNRHPLSAPWNAYATKDGWILVCTVSNEQWLRLAQAIDPALVVNTRYATLNDRVRCVDELDQILSIWTSQLTTAECLAICETSDIPAGPIQAIDKLTLDPNVQHRKMIQTPSGQQDRSNWLPGVPFKQTLSEFTTESELALKAHERTTTDSNPKRELPLAGLRVVEVGQYTTAPLVCKNLASLGAEVIKVEPLAGDASREWAPGQGSMGYFFALSNSDKLTVTLDLKSKEGVAQFCALLGSSDVLVENMRPGALGRIVNRTQSLESLNPSLIHCAISGFGADSAYPNRPAFDTVAQAMSGIMDLTRRTGTPMKAGISAADILGGQVALFAILCALRQTSTRTKRGGSIDVAMQDVGVWATHPVWFASKNTTSYLIASCVDGSALLQGTAKDLQQWALSTHVEIQKQAFVTSLTVKELLSICSSENLVSTQVHSLTEVLAHEHFKARCLGVGRAQDGTFWPLINSPYRLQLTPAQSYRVPGQVGQDNLRVFGHHDASAATIQNDSRAGTARDV